MHYFMISHLKVKLIDLESLVMPDSCYVPDGYQVTTKGAKLTTSSLINRLN